MKYILILSPLRNKNTFSHSCLFGIDFDFLFVLKKYIDLFKIHFLHYSPFEIHLHFAGTSEGSKKLIYSLSQGFIVGMLASLVSCAEADVIDISPARPSSTPLSFTIDKMLQPYFSPAQLQPYSWNKMSKRKNTPEVISSSNHCLSTGRIGNLCCFQRILTIILLSH